MTGTPQGGFNFDGGNHQIHVNLQEFCPELNVRRMETATNTKGRDNAS